MGKKRKKKLKKQQRVMGKHEANLDRATHELDEAIDLLDDGQFIKGAAKGFGAIGRSVKESVLTQWALRLNGSEVD